MGGGSKSDGYLLNLICLLLLFYFFKPIFGGKGCDHILFTPPNNLLLLIPGKLYELVSIFRYVSPG